MSEQPTQTITDAEHQGAKHLLTTAEARTNFVAMAVNRLKDETHVNDFAPELVEAITQELQDWSKTEIQLALKTRLGSRTPPVTQENQARIELVVNNAFAIAADGRVEYKPHPYAAGLKGDACRELEGYVFEFTNLAAKSNGWSSTQTESLHYFLSGLGELVHNCAMFREPVTRDDVLKSVHKHTPKWMGQEFAQRFEQHMLGAFDRIYAKHPSELPYVNMEKDPRGILIRMRRDEDGFLRSY